MTDEQIIKNAEHHKLGSCSQCDYKNYGSNCLHELLNDCIKMAKRLCDDVADFEEGYNDGMVTIGRLKAELKTTKTEIEELRSDKIIAETHERAAKDLFKDCVAQLEGVKKENKQLLQKLQQAKSEAIKEFAERLKNDTFLAKEKNSIEHTIWIYEIDKIVEEMTEVQE